MLHEIATGKNRFLTKGHAYSIFSPDGRYLIFRREGREGTSGIWRIPAEGGEHQRLELGMRGVRDLRVHPDGRRVAFTASPRKGKTEVWVMENFLPPLKDSP